MSISVRQFADQIEKSHTAVNKAIKTGRIPTRALEMSPSGSYKIKDIALAREAMGVQSEPAPSSVPPNTGKGAGATGGNKARPAGSYNTQERENVSQKSNKNENQPDFHKIRSTKEGLQAQLLGLKLKQQAGDLVNRAEVEHEFFSKARQLRDAILNVPSRVAPVLVDMTDAFAVEQFLAKELKDVLSVLAGAGEVKDAG